MATRLYGISLGETSQNVAEGVGSAVAADTVEITIDLADGLSKQEVLIAIDEIKNHIVQGIWPPA